MLSAQLIVATPDTFVFNQIMEQVENKTQADYDMEIVNRVFDPIALVLPHRALNLLSGEFRAEHKQGYRGYSKYLGLGDEAWDAKKVLGEAYYVHFSDWPRPKPWYRPYKDELNNPPKCYPMTPTTSSLPPTNSNASGSDMDCSDKEVWLWLYKDFQDRRKRICGLDLLTSN